MAVLFDRETFVGDDVMRILARTIFPKPVPSPSPSPGRASRRRRRPDQLHEGPVGGRPPPRFPGHSHAGPRVVVRVERLLGRAQLGRDVLEVDADAGPGRGAAAHRVDEHVGRAGGAAAASGWRAFQRSRPASASSFFAARAISMSGFVARVRRFDGGDPRRLVGRLRVVGGHGASPSPSASCRADSSSSASSEPACVVDPGVRGRRSRRSAPASWRSVKSAGVARSAARPRSPAPRRARRASGGPSRPRRRCGPWRSGCSRRRRRGAPPSTTCWSRASGARRSTSRASASAARRTSANDQRRLDPHVDVDAARAGGLRPADEPEVGEHLADDRARPPDVRPTRTPGHRVEIDPQLVGMVEVLGAHRVRVELEAAEVGHPGEAGGVARHDLVGRPARGEARARPSRSSPGATSGARFWKKDSPSDAVRVALEDHRPAARAAQRPVGHGEVVADEVELRDARRSGKKTLSGLRDRHLAAGDLDDLAARGMVASDTRRVPCRFDLRVPRLTGSPAALLASTQASSGRMPAPPPVPHPPQQVTSRATSVPSGRTTRERCRPGAGTTARR